MIDMLFSEIKKHLANSQWFVKWLGSKPTGQFTIQVNVNQGGIRGKPKITIAENI